jgi:hypothetical protein
MLNRRWHVPAIDLGLAQVNPERTDSAAQRGHSPRDKRTQHAKESKTILFVHRRSKKEIMKER